MKTSQDLQPLPYHERLVNVLKGSHGAVWNATSSRYAMETHHAQVELDLLKSTYRLTPRDHRGPYEMLERARDLLGIESPITLYQASQDDPDNAVIYFTPGHGHLVFQGKMLSRFSPEETAAVIGHEVGHFKLWTLQGGDYHTASRILSAAARESEVAASIRESKRLYQLYTEIYADRAGYLVAGQIEPMVSCLVKMITGLEDVNAGDYLEQAEDIYLLADVRSEGRTHPETFIRARSLAAWSGEAAGSGAADALVAAMMERMLDLDTMDLVGQEMLTGATVELFDALFRAVPDPGPEWEAHAQRFLPSWTPQTSKTRDAAGGLNRLKDLLGRGSASVRDYAAYVLLDFATLPPRSDGKTGRALLGLAREIGLEERFQEIAFEEMNWNLAG